MKIKLSVLLTSVFFLFSMCAGAQVTDPLEEAEKEGDESTNLNWSKYDFKLINAYTSLPSED